MSATKERHFFARNETMSEMTEERAREILAGLIQPDGSIRKAAHSPFARAVMFDAKSKNQLATLRGDFTADELEATVFWMRKHA